MKFFTNDALCSEGCEFIADRFLSIPISLRLGCASKDGDIAFPFVVNGKLLRWKSRNMKDKKLMSMSPLPDSMKDIKLPFWNQSNAKPGGNLVITEGEFDTIALTQLGIENVVSLPNGASSVSTSFRSQYAFLQKFKEIYLCFDNDTAGEKAVEEARKLLPVDKFRRIRLPAKDANDWIKSGDATIEIFQDLMFKAEKNQIEEIVLFRDLPKSFYEAIDMGTSTGWDQLDEVIGGIRTGELTVVSADTGAGKTTFCVNLLCNLIKADKSGFWINSWEMDYKIIVRKVATNICGQRLKYESFTAVQIAKFEKWMESHNVLINPLKSKASIEALDKQVELATKVYGVKYILLDHLDYIVGKSKDIPNHERIEEVVLAIHQMAQEHDVHIFLIAHPKQTDDRTGAIHMGQLKGSAAIKQYADNIITIQNMQQVDLSVPDNRVIIAVHKNRLMGRRGQVTLRYIKEQDCFFENSQIFTEK